MFFTEEEIKILNKLNIKTDITAWTDNDYINAEEVIGDEWTAEVQESNMNETEYGKACQILLDKITAL